MTIVKAQHELRSKFWRVPSNLKKTNKEGRANRKLMAEQWKRRRAIPGARLTHRTYMAELGWLPEWR